MNQDYSELVKMPFLELVQLADKTRRENFIENIELCGIVNAKSGSCSEDCKFCAQSAHNQCDIASYELLSTQDIVNAAIASRDDGAKRFGIVTSGNRLNENEITMIAEAITRINDEVDIELCASLGALDKRSFKVLTDAGLTRYHHNIETSRGFYEKIVSTHNFEERIETIKLAKECGLEVCSGGIIGLGETWQDRIDMALLLKELDVDSVPINILVPIKGTPMEDQPVISPNDVIRTIAIFRLILKNKVIKVAAGRESALKDYGSMIYMAGANGMMIGGYLTVQGRSVVEDLEMVRNVQELWTNGQLSS
jgi:biotin synthase